MKATLIQLNMKSADIEDNSEKIKQYINEQDSDELIIFPTLAITGINCCDYFRTPEFIEKQNADSSDNNEESNYDMKEYLDDPELMIKMLKQRKGI